MSDEKPGKHPPASKKTTSRRQSQEAVIADPAAVAKHLETLKDGRRPRPTIQQALVSLSDEAQSQVSHATAAEHFNKPGIQTSLIELDLLNAFKVGERITALGKPHSGKSILGYILVAAAQRTCRRCCAPIISWRDDWTIYCTDPSAWTPTSGVPSAPRCRCVDHAPEIMNVLFIDTEDQFDPVWASTHGVEVGDWSAYRDVDVLQADKAEWSGLRVAPDVKFVVLRPTDSDIAFQVITTLMNSGAIDLIVIDSVAMLAIAEDKETARVASRARFLRRLLPMLLAAQLQANHKFGAKTLVFSINHFMQGPGNMYQNPDQPSSGLALQYFADLRLDVYSKINTGLPDDQKRTTAIMRDFDVTFAKHRGYHHQAHAHGRVFVNDWSSDGGRVQYTAGDTDDADRLLQLVRTAEGGTEDDPDLWRTERSGSSVKCYWLAGRPFKKLRDIHEFLRRPDIARILRFIVFARLLAPAARQLLDIEQYAFDRAGKPLLNVEDPLFKIAEKYSAKTGTAAREARTRAKRLSGAEPVASAAAPGPQSPQPTEPPTRRRRRESGGGPA